MTKKLEYVLIFSLIALTIAGIVIGSVVWKEQNEFTKKVELAQDGVTQTAWDINIEGLYPTKSVEYSVTFAGKTAESYQVVLSFVPRGTTELSKYLDLDIALNGETIETGKLQEYIEGKTVSLYLKIQKDDPAEVILRYTMPEDVGNEAQNAVADFTVNIEAKPEI